MALLLTVAAAAAPPMEGRGSAERGAFIVERWCTSCHLATGSGTDAVPSLAEIGRRRDDAYLRVYLTKPHGEMPDPGLETQGIEDVIAYLRGLSGIR